MVFDSIDAASIPDPPSALADFVRRSCQEAAADETQDQRAQPRFAMLTDVIAVPVDENGVAIGEPFKAVSRDLSTGGFSLLHTAPVESERLAIRIAPTADTEIRCVMEVLRSRKIGQFYDIGGRLIEKL